MSLPVILFVAFFVGAVVLVLIASSRQRKMWANRPGVLRALAAKRGFQFVENPGTPAELVPLRPIEKTGDVKRVELPAAIRGRTVDGEFVLFDLYTQKVSGIGRSRTYVNSYETFITFKSDRRWPHFEFAALAHLKASSLTSQLIGLVVSATESIMLARGLTHVPIPSEPGFQLFVHDPATADRTRDALLRLFASRSGWWVGAKDGALTVLKSAQGKSGTTQNFVPEGELESYLNEAIEIERSLRPLTTPL